MSHAIWAKEHQTITVTDIISEGPIYGLVRGKGSVYLDNEPQGAPNNTDAKLISFTQDNFFIEKNSTTGTLTVAQPFDTNAVLEQYGGKRLFIVRDPLGFNVSRKEYPIWIAGNGYADGAEFGEDRPPVDTRHYAFRRLGEDHDDDHEDDWWPADGVTTGPKFTEEGIEGYVPVRLRHNVTDEVHIGCVYPFENSNWTNADQYLLFTPRYVDSQGLNWAFAEGDDWASTWNGTFFTSSENYAYHLFFDRYVLVKSVDFIQENSDGKFEYTVTLNKPWTHTAFKAVGTNSIHSSVNPDADDEYIHVHKHDFVYGQKVQYKNLTGNAIGGLTDGNYYYIIRTDRNNFKLATTYQNALDNVHIDLTSPGSGQNEFRINDYKIDDAGYDFSLVDSSSASIANEAGSKTSDVAVQFRIGSRSQPPIFTKDPSEEAGITAISHPYNTPILESEEYGGEEPPLAVQGTASNGFQLSQEQIATVDKAKIRISFPAGIQYTYPSGRTRSTECDFQFRLFVKRPGSSTFERVLKTDRDFADNTKNATMVEEIFDLNAHRPFVDFKVDIHRKSVDEFDGDGIVVRKSTFSGVTSIFLDRLTHPYSALGNVSFSSRNFQDMPRRGYHCRGKLIQVPSNYVTREETSDGIAHYRRRSLDGGIDPYKDQDWDGTFRRNVYTNNPAWIFYDMVTNRRYGLGDFIKDTDIDKYALYRIARYCDELVDDGSGRGTLEPRYTMNIYFQKSADAFKVLKDMASNFLSILYYLNGQLLPTQDSPSGPVYSFSKGNILEGAFSYEGTGSKTRYNQVIVEWNNPVNDYELEPLIVEDRRNIIETGRIISKKVVAFGVTSLGQATRYAKWKLWTAINQQEIVSFSTGINGSYITPGDIILVQDSDREAIRFSGRISNTGTLNTKTIPIDSPVTIDASRNYELSAVLQTGAAILASDSATIPWTSGGCLIGTQGSTIISIVGGQERDLVPGIKCSNNNALQADTVISKVNSTTEFEISKPLLGDITQNIGNTSFNFVYNVVKGEVLWLGFVNSTQLPEFLDTEAKAMSARVNAGIGVIPDLLVNWQEDFIVETKKVDKTATGTGSQSSLVLEEAFKHLPSRESIWVLVEKTSDGNITVGSGKEYKVLNTSQNEKNQYDITAVEHYIEKYDAIEKDFQTFVPEPIVPTTSSDDIVPPLSYLGTTQYGMPFDEQRSLELIWAFPTTRKVTVTDAAGAEVDGFIEAFDSSLLGVSIVHDVPGYDNPLTLPKGSTSYKFDVIEPKTYNFAVRTINDLGNRSDAVVKQFTVQLRNQFKKREMLPQSLHYGGTSNRDTEIV